jgi:ankyrin repeat protein
MAAQLPAAEYPHIDRNLFTELQRQCREGLLGELRQILNCQKVLDYFSVRTLRGYTLLHEAVELDQPDVVQMLLLHGVPPNLRAKGGITPLHLACSKSLVDCARALLENGADLTLRDDVGHDAASKADVRSSKKKEAVVKLLRSKGGWGMLLKDGWEVGHMLLCFSHQLSSSPGNA